MANPKPAVPPLPVKGTDARMKRYENIAKVHRDLVEAKWRSITAGAKTFQISPAVLPYCVESIAFLAEEILKLRAMLEEGQFPSNIDLTPINAVKALGKAEAEGKIVEP